MIHRSNLDPQTDTIARNSAFGKRISNKASMTSPDLNLNSNASGRPNFKGFVPKNKRRSNAVHNCALVDK